MAYKMMMPSQVWAGYNALGQLDTIVQEATAKDSYLITYYSFTAHTVDDGSIKASVKVISADKIVSTKAILIVQEYAKAVQEDVLMNLANEGYTVIVPDCTGIGEPFKTSFPPSLDYGNIARAGEHIRQVSSTAKDTSQYLYSMITKRTITFINRELGINDIVIMGIGEATEVAMQTAGSDNRLNGIVCINGAGYKEYLHRTKYGNTDEFEADEKLLSWLTGVAAVAYAKYIDVPVMIAISSNSHDVDIDRLPNILGLLNNNNVSISITAGSNNSIGYHSYNAILFWLKNVFQKETLLQRPKIALTVSEKVIYAEVQADNSIDIEDVNVYYSFGDYDHKVRNYRLTKCQAIGQTQFIAKLEITQEVGPLFVFCDIIYKSGFNLSSIATYAELEKLDFKPLLPTSTRIVYENAMNEAIFMEDSSKAILLQEGIKIKKLPFGLKGIMASKEGLISFDIGRVAKHNMGRILQIDAYTPNDTIFEVILLVKSGGEVEEYTARTNLTLKSGAFTPLKFFANDFKNDKMLSLPDWESVKAIRLTNKGVAIGKILFI